MGGGRWLRARLVVLRLHVEVPGRYRRRKRAAHERYSQSGAAAALKGAPRGPLARLYLVQSPRGRSPRLSVLGRSSHPSSACFVAAAAVDAGSFSVSVTPWPEKQHLATGSNPRLRPRMRETKTTRKCPSPLTGTDNAERAQCLPILEGDKKKQCMTSVGRTFIFLKRVIIWTASVDRGTGEPMPMSWPVSLGSNLFRCGYASLFSSLVPLSFSLDLGLGSMQAVPVANDSGLSSLLRCSGGAGANRSELGMTSIPFFPRFGPWA